MKLLPDKRDWCGKRLLWQPRAVKRLVYVAQPLVFQFWSQLHYNIAESLPRKKRLRFTAVAFKIEQFETFECFSYIL